MSGPTVSASQLDELAKSLNEKVERALPKAPSGHLSLPHGG